MSSQSNLSAVIIAIVILTIIGGVLFFLGKNKQSDDVLSTQDDTAIDETVDTETSEDIKTVIYTENGFDPETITITQGETVRFVNESDNQMWVASDEHPTHTQYAGTTLSEHCKANTNTGFDQCGDGDTFTFTFDKSGTWNYHNHLFSTDQGSVIVE